MCRVATYCIALLLTYTFNSPRTAYQPFWVRASMWLGILQLLRQMALSSSQITTQRVSHRVIYTRCILFYERTYPVVLTRWKTSSKFVGGFSANERIQTIQMHVLQQDCHLDLFVSLHNHFALWITPLPRYQMKNEKTRCTSAILDTAPWTGN